MRAYEIFEDGDNGPALYGTVTLDGGQVSFHPEPGHEAYMDSLRSEWMILDGGERGVSCTGSPEEWFDALPGNISNSYTDVVEKGVTKGAMPPKGGRFPHGVLKENPNHEPAGSPEGGRFAFADGAGIGEIAFSDDDKAKAYLKGLTDSWYKKLNVDEKGAIGTFTDMGFKPINNFLTGRTEYDEDRNPKYLSDAVSMWDTDEPLVDASVTL